MTPGYFAWAVAHPRRVLAAAAALTLVALLGLLHLPVRTAREALMPRDAPAMQRLDAFLADFGAGADLIVVLEGDDPGDFSAALTARLAALPAVGLAFDRVDPADVVERAWLLMPPAALAELAAQPVAAGPADFPAAIAAARAGLDDLPTDADPALAERGLRALAGFLGEWRRYLEAPDVPAHPDLAPALAPVGAEALADGRFRSRDGRLGFIFVRPADPSGEFAVLDPVIAAVRAEAAALRATWAGPAPTVGLAGLPAVAHEEFTAVRDDLQLIVATSAGFILLLVLGWLRSWRRAVALFVPMGLGVVWNLGLAALLVGHLTILTSSFTAILFGLGVDYGIFLSAQILAAQGSGRTAAPAIVAGARAAVRPLVVAGGATALIFGTLATSDFQGFAELGLVAATGVLLVVAATLLVQPALLALLPLKVAEKKEKSPAASAPRRRAPAALVLGVALAGAAASLAAGPVPFDHDVLALLPADSEAVRLQRRMSAESDFQAEVVLLTAPDVAAARALAARVGALPGIARVQSIDPFFPPDAADRVAAAQQVGARAAALLPRLATASARVDAPTLEALRGLLADAADALDTAQEQAFSAGRSTLVAAIEALPLAALRAALARPDAGARTEALATALLARVREAAARVARWQAARPPTPADLPPALQSRFFGRSGAVAVYAWPRESVYDPDALGRLNAEVLAAAPSATGFPITHHVFAAQVVAAYREGTLLAAGAALLFLIVALRRPGPIVLAALPLALGGVWMNGLLHLLGESVNFANIVALPLTMGLAIDYGVWLAHEATDHPHLGGPALARRAGGPILLAAATTLAGLGAITLARYAGVASMGRSLTLGLLACVAAALVVAPALVHLFPRRTS
ncbi:MAG: MMPL family transporter [Myxococcales bacterium]|nr:MMPL family transporter [Myxococcales bacterium]